jgi:hypothetical protein
MLWLVQNIIFSVSLIVIIHYLYLYFETTLTAPKVKDLIHCPKQKYKSLFDTIHKNLDNASVATTNVGSQSASAKNIKQKGSYHHSASDGLGDSTYINDLGKCDDNNVVNDMKNDLKTFLRGIGLKSKTSTDAFRANYETS